MYFHQDLFPNFDGDGSSISLVFFQSECQAKMLGRDVILRAVKKSTRETMAIVTNLNALLLVAIAHFFCVYWNVFGNIWDCRLNHLFYTGSYYPQGSKAS